MDYMLQKIRFPLISRDIKKELPTFKYEKPLWRKGYLVIGVDEVGRGALAGPLGTGISLTAFI